MHPETADLRSELLPVSLSPAFHLQHFDMVRSLPTPV